MNFPKEKFIFSVKFKDTIYNKETYTDLAENFMEEYGRDTFARMTLDNMLFDGFNLICHIIDLSDPRLQFFLDLKNSFKFVSIEELEQTSENESLFCGKFEFEAILFNEQTYGLMYGGGLTWDDILHKDETQYAREDIRDFLQYAVMQELKDNLQNDRDEDYNCQMIDSLEVFKAQDEYEFDIHSPKGQLKSTLYSAQDKGLKNVGDFKECTDYYEDGTLVIMTRIK